MTKREFFTAVIATVENADLKAFAECEIAKMDKANENKRAGKSSKVAESYAPYIESVKAILTDKPMLGTEIAERVGISKNKVPHLMSLVGATVTEVTVPKVGKRKAYSLQPKWAGQTIVCPLFFYHTLDVKRLNLNKKIRRAEARLLPQFSNHRTMCIKASL